MVVAEIAELFVGDESRGTVQSGALLTFTQTEETWLFIPARSAWINAEQVVPIEKSEAYFTQVIDQDPSAEAYHHRGIARHALGHHELAMQDLDEAIKLGLKSPALFINRANVWHSLGNHRNALSDITQAIDAQPENALAYNNRSLIHAALGNLDQSLADATEAIRLEPTNADAYNNRGVTRVKQAELEAAVRDYTEAIRLNPRFADAYANRGFANKQLARYEAALTDYRRAMELAPEASQAFNDAAWLIATCPDEKHRNGQLAVQYATYACKLTDQKNGDFLDTLAAAYASDGKFPQAVKTQQQALTLLPEASRDTANQRLQLYRSQRAFIEGQ